MSEHSPAPVPTRGVYGFALYLACWSAFIIYLVWAFIPDEWLHQVGITYYPQKYWAVALPVYTLMGLSLFAFFVYPAMNQTLAPPLDSILTITDPYSTSKRDPGRKTDVPQAYDLSISYVSQVLYIPRSFQDKIS